MAYTGLPYGQFRDGGSSVPRYTYRPLPPDSIRLLKIREDHEQAEIQCDLDIESLDNPPRYTALSYAWEDPPIFNTQPPALAQYILPNPYNYSFEANQQIYITGKVLTVGKNLYAALRYLRSSGSRTVWTDAICLNQESDAEKVKQIRQMGKIYSRASMVVIWLGPAYLYSDLAIEMVRNLVEVVHRAEFRQMFRSSVEQEAPPAVQWTLAIYALLHRAYWGRSWIVQEVALARGGVQVACGTKTINWETMTELLSFLQLESDAISRLLYKAGHGLGYYGQNLPPNFKWNDYAIRLSKACKRIHDYGRTNLLDILAKTRHTRAGKEVDLIYSKLGLSTDGDFLVPEISYKTPVQELYVELVQNSILYSDSLDILSHSALQHPSWKPRFPSWMPDWKAHEIHEPLIEVLPNRPMTGYIFQAAGDSTPQVIVRTSRYNNRGELLMLHSFFKAEGFVIDIVDGLGASTTRIYGTSATTAPQGQTQPQNFLAPWIRLINDELSDKTGSQPADIPLIQPWYNTTTNNRYSSAQAILSAIWRSIVANQDDLDRPSNGASPGFPAPADFGTIFALRCAQAEDSLYQDWARMPNFHYFQCWYMPNRELIICGRALCQWAQMMQPEANMRMQAILQNTTLLDAFNKRWATVMHMRRLVVTASGWIGVVPVEARPNDRICVLLGGKVLFVVRDVGAGKWEFVGECYLHGLMGGEAMGMLRQYEGQSGYYQNERPDGQGGEQLVYLQQPVGYAQSAAAYPQPGLYGQQMGYQQLPGYQQLAAYPQQVSYGGQGQSRASQQRVICFRKQDFRFQCCSRQDCIYN